MLSGLFIGAEAVSLSGVLGEVTALIPVILPIIIGFIAFRKGLAFIIGSLRGA